MGEIPLMSRETELNEILARLTEPEPVAFVLAGEAGVGKTRLASVYRCTAPSLAPGKIPARLVLSVRTVDNHLQNVYGKLGVTSRDELARVLRG